jgi:iron complex transport system substrate-binding protein
LYKELGVDFVPITSAPGDENTNYNAFFYEFNSFELAGKYPADLILFSELPGAMNPAQLASVPTWAALPAVKAAQLLPWRVLDPFSHKVMAEDLDAVAQAITHAHVVS